MYGQTFRLFLVWFLPPFIHAPVRLSEPHAEMCTRVPAALVPTVHAVLFLALSLLPHQLQNHPSRQGSAPAAESNADHCPDARWSLPLACIQHSHLFNYFCSVPPIFLSLLGDKQAQSLPLHKPHTHPMITVNPVPWQKQKQPLVQQSPCPACVTTRTYGRCSRGPTRADSITHPGTSTLCAGHFALTTTRTASRSRDARGSCKAARARPWPGRLHPSPRPSEHGRSGGSRREERGPHEMLWQADSSPSQRWVTALHRSCWGTPAITTHLLLLCRF